MRVVIQRVLEGRVVIAGETVGEIGRGVVVLVGIEGADTGEDGDWLAGKMARMRIFADGAGVMNLSLGEVDGGVLAVSQFTLHASTKKGNRPSYIRAARPEVAVPLWEKFLEALERETGRRVERGVFGADMQVGMVNDGPVTVVMDSKARE